MCLKTSSCEPAPQDLSVDPSVSAPTLLLSFRAQVCMQRGRICSMASSKEEELKFWKKAHHFLSTMR